MIWKLKEKWGWGWEPPGKGRCGAEGGLPTVCPASSQEGDKGSPGVEGPGGQVRRHKRLTRGRVGAGDHGRKGHQGSKGDTRREGKDG